jgi:ribonuclease P protein component
MHRRHRLVHSGRFQQVYREGRSWVHPLLVLRALGNDLPHSRFGFVVGKRVGKAVLRNRVKRLMREAMRLRIGQVPPGLDIVLTARAPVARATFREIGSALDSLLAHLAQADYRELGQPETR